MSKEASELQRLADHANDKPLETGFSAVFNRRYATGRPPIDYQGQVPMTWAEFRREALELFSAGCVHQATMQHRLEELLPGRPDLAPLAIELAERYAPPNELPIVTLPYESAR
jgi:hypothetical protein